MSLEERNLSNIFKNQAELLYTSKIQLLLTFLVWIYKIILTSKTVFPFLCVKLLHSSWQIWAPGTIFYACPHIQHAQKASKPKWKQVSILYKFKLFLNLMKTHPVWCKTDLVLSSVFLVLENIGLNIFNCIFFSLNKW